MKERKRSKRRGKRRGGKGRKGKVRKGEKAKRGGGGAGRGGERRIRGSFAGMCLLMKDIVLLLKLRGVVAELYYLHSVYFSLSFPCAPFTDY